MIEQFCPKHNAYGHCKSCARENNPAYQVTDDERGMTAVESWYVNKHRRGPESPDEVLKRFRERKAGVNNG